VGRRSPAGGTSGGFRCSASSPRRPGTNGDALIWGACAIVVLVVGIALAGRTAPAGPLAVTARACSVLLFAGEIVDNLPVVQPRYVIAPALLLYTAIVALLLAVVVGFNFRVNNNRSESPPWTAVVAAATRTCQQPGMGDYGYRHAWWQLQIPCRRVRPS
jgi:hypothetical protein